MKAVFRSFALSAALAGAAVAAHAAPIGFEDLAAKALAAGKPAPLTDQVPGFKFTGATVFHVDQIAGTGFEGPTASSHTGFIQSRDAAGAVSTSLFVELAGSLAGGDIESLSFDLANGNTGVEIYAIDSVAGSSKLFNFNPAGFWSWGHDALDFKSLGTIDRIEFRNTEAGAAIALDNLDFTLADGGGTVPEPAGFGLVALSLFAAGAASRRRRG
jgi:hypothetical protein